MAMLVWGSLRDAIPGLPANLTIKNYDLLLTSRFWALTRNSLILSVGSTVIAVTVGGLLALSVVRLQVPRPRLLDSLITIPAYVTPFIGALGYQLLLSPRVGYINGFFSSIGLPTLNIYSYAGIIYVMGLYQAPVAYLYLRPALMRIDASFEEVARVMGASPRRTFRSVVFPLAKPTLLSATIICFVTGIGNFAVPAVLGGTVGIEALPTRLVELIRDYPADPNTGAVIGVFLATITVSLVWVSNRILRGRDYTAMLTRSSQSTRIVPRAGRLLGLAICVAFFVLAAVLPLGMMLIASFQPLFTSHIDLGTLTLDNYRYVFTYRVISDAILNTIFLAVCAAIGGTVLAILLGYIIVRTRLPGRRLVEQLGIAPIALPDSVMGLALLWMWVTIPIAVYGTRWILLIAYIALFLPYATPAAVGAFRQVSADFEDASRVLGATWLHTVRKVVAPLIAPAMLGSAIIILYHTVREVAASLLLYSPGSEVMSVAMWSMFEEGRYTEMFALSWVQIVTVLLLVVAAKRVARWGGGMNVDLAASPGRARRPR